VGVVFQFQGLRGLNWTSSVTQLAATAIMTLLRAWIRRGLIAAKQMLDDHEMDRLALRLAKGGDFWLADDTLYPPVSDPIQPNCNTSKPFQMTDKVHQGGQAPDDRQPRSLLSGTRPYVQTPPLDGESWEAITGINTSRGSWFIGPIPAPTAGHKAVLVRQRLRELVRWPGLVSEAAVSVSASIELVMNKFFSSSLGTNVTSRGNNENSSGEDVSEDSSDRSEEPEEPVEFESAEPTKPTFEGFNELLSISRRFVWALKIRTEEGDEILYLEVTNDDGVWKANSTEIEAILSLWMFHLKGDQSRKKVWQNDPRERRQGRTG